MKMIKFSSFLTPPCFCGEHGNETLASIKGGEFLE